MGNLGETKGKPKGHLRHKENLRKPKVDIEGTPKGNLRDTSRKHQGNLRET